MRTSWIRFFFVACILFASVGCDQATKEIAREHLQYQPELSLFGDTVRLLYTHNPGIAFSIGADWSPRARFWLTVVGAGVSLLIVLSILLLKAPSARLEILGFSLILGGGFSNLLDRLVRDRGVVDFMMIEMGFLRTAVFNVADMLVLFGVVLVIMHSFHTGPRRLQPDP